MRLYRLKHRNGVCIFEFHLRAITLSVVKNYTILCLENGGELTQKDSEVECLCQCCSQPTTKKQEIEINKVLFENPKFLWSLVLTHMKHNTNDDEISYTYI